MTGNKWIGLVKILEIPQQAKNKQFFGPVKVKCLSHLCSVCTCFRLTFLSTLWNIKNKTPSMCFNDIDKWISVYDYTCNIRKPIVFSGVFFCLVTYILRLGLLSSILSTEYWYCISCFCSLKVK